MKNSFTYKKLLRFAAVLGLWFTAGGAHAQTTDPITLGGPEPIIIGNGQTEQWYGDVTLRPDCRLYIEDGASIQFYGTNFTIMPGAQIYGGTGDFSNAIQGMGSGKIVFMQPNPNNSTSVLQTLDGGNGGKPANATQNTIPSIEINNPSGVKLVNSDLRIGSNLNFVSGHLYADIKNVVMNTGATITGYDQNKFVVTASTGFLAREGVGTTAASFPVGSSDVAGDYLPDSLTNTGTVDRYDVRAIASLTPAPGTGAATYLTRSWQIVEAVAGGSNVTLSAQHAATNQGASYADPTAVILSSPATANWKKASTGSLTRTVGSVTGSLVMKLTGITDFSTNTYFTKGAPPPTPDFSPTISMDAVNFAAGGSVDFVVTINELANFPSTGPITFRVVKGTNFTITYSATTTTANVYGGVPVNNADWTVTDMGGYFQCTLNTGKTINGKGYSYLGFTVARTAGATAGTTQSITAAILPNSGGDGNSANNSTTTVITAL